MHLDDLNTLPEDRAVAALLRCCGSMRWARRMAAARPFASFDAMMATADAVSVSLEAEDWLEAFRAHPRIGSAGGSAASETWSEQEQAGVRFADTAVRDRLAEANRHYEARFGYIFIVCATGRSAAGMLATLEQRLANDPDTELRTASEEQRKITRLRIEKLLTS